MQSTKFIKHFLLSFLLLITVVAQAQVGIGTATPAASAQLDVSSTTKGFLPPRMDSTQRNAIVSPAAGLIIYNTTLSRIEIYNGSAWYAPSAAVTAVPYTGATGAVNLGAYDLIVNGLTVGRGSNNISSNTATGFQSLFLNTTGFDNTANGDRALHLNTTGSFNTANGFQALYSDTTGSSNTANGYQSLFLNTSGSFNTATGLSALFSNTIGTNNTAIGYGADVGSNNLTNATAIGNGANVDASNKIQLGNASVTSVNTSGKLTTGLVTYPNAHGTSGQVLSTTGSGELSWITQSAGAVTSLGAIGDSSTTKGATITSGVLSLAPADTSNGGIVTTGAQTFAGNKIFNANVGIGTTTPAASAQLDVSSTTKGFLPPRMNTAERDLIATPATGLVIFNTTTNGLEFKSSTGWVSLKTSSDAAFLPTIVIGTQQWMRENLDVVTYRNGDIIPQVTDSTAWAALTTGAWCYRINDPANGAIYGKLYNWYAVNDARGLAPQGWHIPTDTEWTTLSTKLGGEPEAGGKMKTTGTTGWTTPNLGATNESSFAGLPGGYRAYDGPFGIVGHEGVWWSATGSNTTNAWFRTLYYFGVNLFRNSLNKAYGFSVRCIRD